MQATLHGAIIKPAFAIVGTWDPLYPAHRQLFQELVADAKEARGSALVVVIEPPPPLLMFGYAEFPIYNDIDARLEMILHLGVDGVICLHFTKEDLRAGAEEFLCSLTANIQLAELWLGASQSLGRGEAGSFATIASLAERRNITVKRLPAARVATGKVKEFLATGQLVQATKAVGRPPIRKRPQFDRLRFAWPPGPYRVATLDLPWSRVEEDCSTVDLVPETEQTVVLDWPNQDIAYLAFVAGPGDAPDALASFAPRIATAQPTPG